MKSKQKIYMLYVISALVFFFIIPNVGYAVDYTVTDVTIDAYLQENGEVKVRELHTYSFDGKFNGITRTIIPKKDASITDFEANENGHSLLIEKEKELYKVYRKGKDETITVELTYTIENGVHVYRDVAEFYWPFFDKRNESTYENMQIVIHPPIATNDVIAFGYDIAFEKEEIQGDGSVLFQLGKVLAEKNGDIRVAYNAPLFPSAQLTADQAMRDEILMAKQELYEKAAARMEMRGKLSKIGLFVVPFFALVLIFIFARASMIGRMKKFDVERRAAQTFYVPKEMLSMPATIYFTKGQILPETVAAALLDLIRKGYVSQLEGDRFKLERTPSDLLKHEELLIDFLFEDVAYQGKFSFEALKTYTKKRTNQTKYRTTMMKWQQAVIKEVNEHNLYEKVNKFRIGLVFVSIILTIFIFFFANYGLIGYFIATLILFLTFIGVSIFYNPKTTYGLMIVHEWEQLKKRLADVSIKEWAQLSDDEQMRVYIYGLGTNDKDFIKKNEELIEAFKRPENMDDHNNLDKDFGRSAPDLNASTLLLIGPSASSSFHGAHKTTSTSMISSSSSSGGGVGGGGGGSGAF